MPNLSDSRSMIGLQDSPILACAKISTQDDITISSGMSGQVVVYDHGSSTTLCERRDHKKYVVKIATHQEGDNIYVATAGWDAKVFLYEIVNSSEWQLGSPVATLDLDSNPETVLFVRHPDSREPILLITRRDSTFLHFYRLPERHSQASSPPNLELLGRQNLAPHSNAWIAFSPSSVAVSPIDPTLVAVATSAVPHLKLILVRLLLPSATASATASRPGTQAAQMRDELAVQDREEAAIQLHVSTSAPQTPYSTPQVVWRPDGTGVWVNGDDGVVRGLEVKSGKVVAALKDGHEAGSKIRSICCGHIDVNGTQEEWLVSGGFDRRLVVWRPETTGSSQT